MNVTVINTTLFHVAGTYLGDPTQWDRIARLNGIDDPILMGTVVLRLPVPSPSVQATGGAPA